MSRTTLVLATLIVVAPSIRNAVAEIVFPQTTWKTKKPHDVNLNADKLNAFAKAVGGDGVVVRDGYLPALVFNMGKEHNENYRLHAALAYMKQLADIDPYDHPRGIHNVNSPNNDYIEAPQIDFTSFKPGLLARDAAWKARCSTIRWQSTGFAAVNREARER